MTCERERGGTFTFASMILSAALLISAGLFASATQSSYRGAAASARRSVLREGAFAGGTWALAKSPQSELKGTLKLSGCEVRVEAQRDAKGLLLVKATASNAIGETQAFTLRYGAKGKLESFVPLKKSK